MGKGREGKLDICAERAESNFQRGDGRRKDFARSIIVEMAPENDLSIVQTTTVLFLNS